MAEPEPQAQPMEFDWRPLLEGTEPPFKRRRAFHKRLPSAPRCKLCYAPFRGIGGLLMRHTGHERWPKNPKYCAGCFHMLEMTHGGAEIEVSLLFADVRGSTAMAERVTPTQFRKLMNRFYETAAKVLVERDAVVDKFVGDEVVALFVPAMSGADHPGKALDAARELMRATGHDEPGGAWMPIGIGVHTGRAFVGSIGDSEVTDFTALGDAVNTTARLASMAGAGEALVTDSTARAGSLPTEGLERRHLELRGRTEPVDVVVLRPGREVVTAS